MATEILYIESSIPTGITISEYRRCRPQRRSLWTRLVRRHAA
jgi:hypothetical protein